MRPTIKMGKQTENERKEMVGEKRIRDFEYVGAVRRLVSGSIDRSIDDATGNRLIELGTKTEPGTIRVEFDASRSAEYSWLASCASEC